MSDVTRAVTSKSLCTRLSALAALPRPTPARRAPPAPTRPRPPARRPAPAPPAPTRRTKHWETLPMSSSPILACAAYIRTSTDDQQSPEDSKRWQLDIATRLVAPVGGKIVAIYHDIDVTRELPWTRRAEASR